MIGINNSSLLLIQEFLFLTFLTFRYSKLIFFFKQIKKNKKKLIITITQLCSLQLVTIINHQSWDFTAFKIA
jgi:hypothetical protein